MLAHQTSIIMITRLILSDHMTRIIRSHDSYHDYMTRIIRSHDSYYQITWLVSWSHDSYHHDHMTRIMITWLVSWSHHSYHDHITRIVTWLSGDASAVADTTRGVRSIRFHPNGQHLAVGDRAGNLKWAGGHSLLCCHGSESGHQLEWPSDMTYVVVYLTLSQGRGSKHELEGSGDYWVLSWLCQISCLVWTNQWNCAVHCRRWLKYDCIRWSHPADSALTSHQTPLMRWNLGTETESPFLLASSHYPELLLYCKEVCVAWSEWEMEEYIWVHVRRNNPLDTHCSLHRVYDLHFMDQIIEVVAHDSEILCIEYSPLFQGIGG